MSNLIVGCGYLGSRVAQRWLEQGLKVAALTRCRPDRLLELGVKPITGDVLRPGSLSELPKASTLLYAVGYDRAAGGSFRDVYIDGLKNVLDAVPRPERFIYVSSTSVYGQIAGEWINEDSPTKPTEENGKIIFEAENLLRDRYSDAIILRFAGIYGPGRVLRRVAIEKGEPLVGDAERWLNLIHVDDGANVIVAAAERGRAGQNYLVADDQPVRRREFYTFIAELLSAPAPRFEPLKPGSPLPPHEAGNRRMSNRKIKDEFELTLNYPTYRDGLPSAIGKTI